MDYTNKSISFSKNNLQLNKDTWNEDHNNNLTKWLESGDVVKVEEWLFVGKAILERNEIELNKLYSLIDLRGIDIEAGVNLSNIENENIANRFTFFFDDFIPKSTPYFKSSVLKLFDSITLQPYLLIKAKRDYPDTLSKSQQIYHRYDYLNKRLSFARDKYIERSLLISTEIRKEIAGGKRKITRGLFFLVEQFIEELKRRNRIPFDYFNSKLFRFMFSEILKFKGYYLDVFETFPFQNILEIEKKIYPDFDTSQKVVSDKSGFNTWLTNNQIELLFYQLKDNKYIGPRVLIQDFKCTFLVLPFTYSFIPVKWIKGKNSCRWLLELLSDYQNSDKKHYIPDNVRKNIIPEIFIDKNGNKMNIGKPDNRADEYHLNQFNSILTVIKKKTDLAK